MMPGKPKTIRPKTAPISIARLFYPIVLHNVLNCFLGLLFFVLSLPFWVFSYIVIFSIVAYILTFSMIGDFAIVLLSAVLTFLLLIGIAVYGFYREWEDFGAWVTMRGPLLGSGVMRMTGLLLILLDLLTLGPSLIRVGCGYFGEMERMSFARLKEAVDLYKKLQRARSWVAIPHDSPESSAAELLLERHLIRMIDKAGRLEVRIARNSSQQLYD